MDLSNEHFRAMIFYDFKYGLVESDCLKRLQMAFGEKSPTRATVYRWFAEFKRDRTSLSDEFREGRPKTAVTPQNVDAVRSLIMEDSKCTYRLTSNFYDIFKIFA